MNCLSYAIANLILQNCVFLGQFFEVVLLLDWNQCYLVRFFCLARSGPNLNLPCFQWSRSFQPSRWTMALSRPIFSFRSLNKLSPLVGDFKILYTVCAHHAQDHLSQVWWTSVNFKDNKPQGNCRTVEHPLRPSTLKRKSGCPPGIKKTTSRRHFRAIAMKQSS